MKRTIQERARAFAVSHVSRLAFEGRRGHGGAVNITKRVLTYEQLQRELHHVISRYEDGVKHFTERCEECD